MTPVEFVFVCVMGLTGFVSILTVAYVIAPDRVKKNRRYSGSIWGKAFLWFNCSASLAEGIPVLALAIVMALSGSDLPAIKIAIRNYLGHATLEIIAVGVLIAALGDSVCEGGFHRKNRMALVPIGLAIFFVAIKLRMQYVSETPFSDASLGFSIGLSVIFFGASTSVKLSDWKERKEWDDSQNELLNRLQGRGI